MASCSEFKARAPPCTVSFVPEGSKDLPAGFLETRTQSKPDVKLCPQNRILQRPVPHRRFDASAGFRAVADFRAAEDNPAAPFLVAFAKLPLLDHSHAA